MEKGKKMWHTRGLRGSFLEERINDTNECYQKKHLALVQKIPTPIKPIQINAETRQITLAYFEQKSTVDYIGIVQGIGICFDAKECQTETFPLQHIHAHQLAFMQAFEEQGGVAFLLISYTICERIFYLPLKQIEFFFERAKQGGRKSFRLQELDPLYEVPLKQGMLIHYLEPLARDLQQREQQQLHEK